MRAKTFTYNQMIQFFQSNKLPLTQQQIQLIGTKVKEEMQKMDEYKAKKKAKADKRYIERENRKELDRRTLGYSRIGLNNV